jgi:replicative DNA helicase
LLELLDFPVLISLYKDSVYAREVLPHLTPDFFFKPEDKELFTLASERFHEFGDLISPEAARLELRLRLKESPALLQSTIDRLQKLIDTPVMDENTAYMVQKTESWAKARSAENGLYEGMALLKKGDAGAMLERLRTAIGFSFQSAAADSYFADAPEQYEFYTSPDTLIPFSPAFRKLNEDTGGGFPRKTMLIWVAPPGVGKTLVMCNEAAYYAMTGRKVLYVTLEMSRRKIHERIDANLMRTETGRLRYLDRSVYFRQKRELAENSAKLGGDLKVLEFPTGGLSPAGLRKILSDLSLKHGWTPDVLFVDYLGLMAPSGGVHKGENSYSILKRVAEEMRGIATEFDQRFITAHQLNKEGKRSSDPDMDDVADSFALPMTADGMIAIFRPKDDADKATKLIVKWIKTRQHALFRPGRHKFTVIGVDYERMFLYEVVESAKSQVEMDRAQAAYVTRLAEGGLGDFTQQPGDRPAVDFSQFQKERE